MDLLGGLLGRLLGGLLGGEDEEEAELPPRHFPGLTAYGWLPPTDGRDDEEALTLLMLLED